VVLLSTLGPRWVRALLERLPDGVGVVDAPVSGGTVRAADGTLLIMAAGADEQSAALLAVLGEAVSVGDQPGQGQAMKMVNQVLCGVHIAATAEALALAGALGIDPELAWQTVRRGAAASFMLDDRGERMVHGTGGSVRSALALFVKDLGLVLEESTALDLPTDVVAAAARLFTEAAAARGAGRDDSELYSFLATRRS
jgi:3-hydroxyisobutyrate dehydrogenase